LAQYNLGRKYANGEGVAQEYIEAYKWFSIAATRVKVSADRDRLEKERDILATKMTPQQIAEAQALARGWKSPQ